MSGRRSEIDTALAQRWKQFLDRGEPAPLLHFLEEHPEVTRTCRHRYPWSHRLLDTTIGDRDYRVSRCVTCGEKLAFTPIAFQSVNHEAGVPLWLTGDALKRWVEEEDEHPAGGPINWEVQRWRLLGEANLEGLTESLRKGDSADQIEVASVLGEVGPRAREALPFVRHLAESSNQWVRLAGAKAAWRIAGDAAEALPAITAALQSARDTLRKAQAERDNSFGDFLADYLRASVKDIVDFLGEMGAEAQPAIPSLFGLLEENWAELRDPVLVALARIEKDTRSKGKP